MSIINCHSCGRGVDTDFHDPVCYMDKYWYCEKCLDKSEVFEVLDEMQETLNKGKKAHSAMVKLSANAINELRAVQDSAKQGLKRLGCHA